MASSSLLTKILADFLFGLYLLNQVFKHATNHTQNRYHTFERNIKNNTKNHRINNSTDIIILC